RVGHRRRRGRGRTEAIAVRNDRGTRRVGTRSAAGVTTLLSSFGSCRVAPPPAGCERTAIDPPGHVTGRSWPGRESRAPETCRTSREKFFHMTRLGGQIVTGLGAPAHARRTHVNLRRLCFPARPFTCTLIGGMGALLNWYKRRT